MGLDEPPVEVVVRLETTVTAQGDPESPQDGEAAQAIDAVVRRFGGRLRPQNPGVADPELAAFFVVDVASPAHAARLVEALSGLAGVDAAYVKPQPMMP